MKYAVLALVGLCIAVTVVAGCGKTETREEQVTGVWQVDGSEKLFTIDLMSEKKSIKIGDQSWPVTIKKIDDANDIIVLEGVQQSGAATWSVRQVWQDDKKEKFNLTFTFEDGKTVDLNFVRPL